MTLQEPRFKRKHPRQIHDEHVGNSARWRSEGILWLHDVRSALNVGSAFRTADAMGLHGIILSGHSPQPPHPSISKTALGAEEWVRWSFAEDPVRKAALLRDDGYQLIALEQVEHAVSMDGFVPASSKWCLIAGSEVRGLDPAWIDLCDTAVQIDQFGRKHSLNVAVAIGIATFSLDAASRVRAMSGR